mgnify:CR=1 FL=1
MVELMRTTSRVSFGASTRIQTRVRPDEATIKALAERIVERVPSVELVRFVNSGTEAAMSAVRLARGVTGRDTIIKFEGCYHGWHDYAQWSVTVDPENMGPAERPNMTPGSGGIPGGARDTMLVLPFNENAFRLIEEHAHELAGVAIEPVLGGGMLTVDKAFIQKLGQVTKKAGVLRHLIGHC